MPLKYVIKPLDHALLTEFPSTQIPGFWSPDQMNVRIKQKSVQSRFGYAEDRDLGTGVKVDTILLYNRATTGTRYCVYLTDTNAAIRKTGSGETWQYITETYATGTISSITGTTVEGSGTTWVSAMAGDKFIVDSDHQAAAEEDIHWATISSVTDADTLELTANYTGAGSTGTYKIRRIYALPANEKWWSAVVEDVLYVGHGAMAAQSWNGANYLADVDATRALNARYGIEFANRLCIADIDNGGNRDPYRFRCSDEGDATAWAGSTSDIIDFTDTEDYISGLGKVGPNIIVYKSSGIHFGERTGVSTAPIRFSTYRPGVGLIAPYSVAKIKGTEVFLGNDDFYAIMGTQAVPASREKVRYKFFDIVDPTEAENTWGFADLLRNQVIWTANTSEGKYQFIWDVQTDEWLIYQFGHDMSGAGKGAV